VSYFGLSAAIKIDEVVTVLLFFFKLNHRGALRAARASVYFAARKMYAERELIESLNAARSRFKLSMKLSNFNGEIITWEITVRASLCRRVIWGAVLSVNFWKIFGAKVNKAARGERKRKRETVVRMTKEQEKRI
jgi:hypothetical protein